MSPRPRVSIVCPAYQEAEGLPHFHAALGRVLDALEDDYEFEILYVDDGSTDGTLEVLRDLARFDGRVRYLSLSRNFGGQAAMTAGLEHAGGEAVVTLDCDLQHPPEVIGELLRRWRAGADVVLTRREEDPGLSRFKRWTSRLFYRAFNALASRPIPESASDFRLLSRRVVDALLGCRETHRLMRGLVGWLGFPTAVVSFRPATRSHGETKYPPGRLLALAVDSLLSFSRVPLRLAFGLALVFLALGPLVLVGGLVHQLALGGTAWLGLALVALLCAMNGSVLFAVGLVGEYVGRIYEQVKDRPLYLLKETSDEAKRVGYYTPARVAS